MFVWLAEVLTYLKKWCVQTLVLQFRTDDIHFLFTAVTLKSLCRLHFGMGSSVLTLFLSVAGEPEDICKGSAAAFWICDFPTLPCWVYITLT